VIPTRVPKTLNASGQDTQGFGRFVTLDEISILFWRVPPATTADDVKVRAVLLFSMFTPGCGYPGLAERYSMKVNVTPGPGGWRLSDPAVPNSSFPLAFPASAWNIVDVDAYSAPIGAHVYARPRF